MTHTVLIVDDSLTVRMDLAEAFEAAGFVTFLAASLADARTLLAHERVNLAVLDVILPDGDGIELLSEMRGTSATADTAVLMLSGEAEVRDRVRGLSIGADDYVGKPYDTGHVVARARQLLSRSRRSEAPEADAPRTILVIDDSPTFRAEARRVLEASRYAVLVAASGEEGLRIAAERRPVAVIVDGLMPGLDGAAVIRSIRLDAALRHTPCVLLTAAEDAESELRALDAGADAFARKEDGLEVMLARLSAVLRHAHRERNEAKSLLAPTRILAVDDSPTYLDALSSALRREGYDVVLARSGEQALDLLAAQPVDCILLDMMMPGMDGKQTCQHIRASSQLREIPVIILTGLEQREAMIDGLSVGADDYIPKSSDFEVVRARIRAQLRRRQFEDEHRRMREELARKEVEAEKARAAAELAEVREHLLADLERKNAELARAKETAERESAFKSKFLANMSHELRTPLNAIIGFSELLEDEMVGTLQPQQKEFVRNVLTSGRHLVQLINDILDLAKIEAGKVELHFEWSPLPALLDSVLTVLAPLAHKKGVELACSLQPDLPELYADPVRLKQVLYNLLSNGIKFTPRGGQVRLLARAVERQLELMVEDTGIGIRAEDLSRLFREFERLGSPLQDSQEGTGLGLALTKHLVELHGGTIAVSSEPGQGTRVTVALPMIRTTGRRSQAPLEPLSDLSAAPVLVIEDDPHGAELIATGLRSGGFAVAVASDAEHALRLARELKPVAITLDILMPGTNGWDLLARLKSDPGTCEIPVVIVSAMDDTSRGLWLGAADYLVKPVPREALLSSLQNASVCARGASGLRVLTVGQGPGTGTMNEIESRLRSCGCDVRRIAALHDNSWTPAATDLVIVDVNDAPGAAASGLAQMIAHACSATLPAVVGFVGRTPRSP